MSFLEYIGERANPGPVGGADFGGDDDRPPERNKLVLRLILAGVLLLVFFLTVPRVVTDPKHLFAGLICYLCLAWLVRPNPDMRNMGFFGFIDNPFRYSDDINRFLFFLKIFLLPGVLVADPLWDLFRMVTGFNVREPAPPRQPRAPGEAPEVTQGPLGLRRAKKEIDY